MTVMNACTQWRISPACSEYGMHVELEIASARCLKIERRGSQDKLPL